MVELAYRSETSIARGSSTDWGAIWAGVFTFVAIWSVFGLLGIAIFASAGNLDAANPLMGMTLGMGIWAVVLTIIAMYVAGRETCRLAEISNRHDGLSHGMIMFGLSVVTMFVLGIVAASGINGGPSPSGRHSQYLLGVFHNLGWTGFLSLFLGWLAAMGGASTGVQHRSQPERTPEQIRPAA